MKKNGKINDTWTTDGRVKIRTLYNRIKNIETMAWRTTDISDHYPIFHIAACKNKPKEESITW